MRQELITVWITKYALSQGILKREAETTHRDGMVVIREQFPTYFHGEGKEWHRTRESAIARVAIMKKGKIASLKKSLAKLDKEIQVPE